jgi:hypothetical protein
LRWLGIAAAIPRANGIWDGRWNYRRRPFLLMFAASTLRDLTSSQVISNPSRKDAASQLRLRKV